MIFDTFLPPQITMTNSKGHWRPQRLRAKLCNIFSTEFILETADSKSKKKYAQAWTSNMSKMDKAKISDNKGDDFTKITFAPDFKKFGMSGMDDDFEALVKRRVYDLAGTNKGSRSTLTAKRSRMSVTSRHTWRCIPRPSNESEAKKH
jgi:DNA gyrase/topoisomerase IV subunit B